MRGFPSRMIITKGRGGRGKGGERGAQHPRMRYPPFFPPLSLSVCLSLSRARRRVQTANKLWGNLHKFERKGRGEFAERGGRRCYRRRRTLLDIHHHHHLRDIAVMMMLKMIIVIIIAGFFGDRQKQRRKTPPSRPNGKRKSSGFSSCGRWFYSSPTSPSLSLLLRRRRRRFRRRERDKEAMRMVIRQHLCLRKKGNFSTKSLRCYSNECRYRCRNEDCDRV